MPLGENPQDKALRAAWLQFCDRLRDAGDQAFKASSPAQALQRADAFRFLTQNLGQAFDLALETKDTHYPELHLFCTPNCKLGGDAADFTYQQAWLDGGSVYKITGKRGTARFLNFTLQGARPETQPGTGHPSLHEPFGDIPEANLMGQQLMCAADGSFELYLGGEKKGANWLPTTLETRKLFVRQGFDAWDETPAHMTIERVGMEAPRPLPTPQVMIAAFDWAGDFITGLMRDWPDHPFQYGAPVVRPDLPNTFPQTANDASDRKRGRAVAHMVWTLAPDEALIVEFDTDDSFWLLTNSGAFFNSMDYLYRPVSYTPARTSVDADGKIRLVLAHDDPGFHNWVDTQTFPQGNMTFRTLMSPSGPELRTQVVKRAALNTALPHAAKITPEERRVQMHTRFNAIRRRYALL